MNTHGINPSVFPRRRFLQATALATAGFASGGWATAASRQAGPPSSEDLALLPAGTAPKALDLAHFPSRLHAFVWRNWPLVPAARMGEAVGATADEILRLGRALGLSRQPAITADQQRRSYISVIKRNWHLLPYDQLLTLLGWTAPELAFALREDDFLFVKLGNLKPACAPLRYVAGDAAMQTREAAFARTMREEFAGDPGLPAEALFHFVEELSRPPARGKAVHRSDQLRYCYSYFALYGDPLLEPTADPYPDGLLARLADTGVNGVWLQAVLHKLAPCPWLPERSAGAEDRLANLRRLVARAARHGVRVFLYLNEPRAMPLAFFTAHPELKGVVGGDHATLCTSQVAVRDYLSRSITTVCRAVPDLGGFFTITASENLTSCWSHGGGAGCPRCKTRTPSEVIGEVIGAFASGIRAADGRQRLIAWDWGWSDAWAADLIARLPAGVSLQSVSEWSLPIERGGVKNQVGEYSISSVGPGPRARRHWELARARGLPVLAKIQAGNTWELSAVPYIPALKLVAEHARNLRGAHVDGLMLGWTLGGYPSPNLEAMAEVLAGGELATVAERRFGPALAPAVMDAWDRCSEAFREFPYDGGVVYNAPLQTGPANLLWGEPTGYAATMVGFPYDHLDGWRSLYPATVFIAQLDKVAAGFATAAQQLGAAVETTNAGGPQRDAARSESRVMAAAALHWQSAADQARFVVARGQLSAAKTAAEVRPLLAEIERIFDAERVSAHALHALQSRDSRLGFEASNHYFYVPMDLAEKVLNCRDLRDRWLPAQRARFGL